MIASTQITTTETFAFKPVAVFNLLSHKEFFINRKYNRKLLKSSLLFKEIENFTDKLLQTY